ncbi:MAG: hypothetical protein HXX12_13880 [Geothrix sp.]|uniref:hypothetical protein n=1 Tax=Geothrix sp. TaxID=1962974 RepID=UPI0018039E59|nr:hypothetical protein [Geothrix sp.]NWJ42047.1 hypothetical protein [Geothrix sp.]WIL19985.1 MAG: hypothetical protein QOZ81_002524 [Geothrix sp.]
MRLGALFLTVAVLAAPGLAAQGRQPLPWEGLAPLDWQARPDTAAGTPYEATPSSGPVEARLTADGTLSVKDARGIIRLQTGLPGRPLKAWRDGGLPLPAPSGAWSFPSDSPLSQGLGGLLWGAADFRPFLRGLLWVIEDGETVLTVAHPATARVIHLPLPPGRDLHLSFLPDRLEVSAGEVDRGAPRRWAIPWMGLLPRLAALGPQTGPAKAGSALAPFPKE